MAEHLTIALYGTSVFSKKQHSRKEGTEQGNATCITNTKVKIIIRITKNYFLDIPNNKKLT